MLSLLTIPTSVRADTNSTEGSFFIFPHVKGEYHSDLPRTNDIEKKDGGVTLDLFYSKDFKRLRFLVEAILSDEEKEIERLQLGLLINPETTLWFGRFHNPLGYWNTQYHHGAHLQATIHRPGIIEYEDDGGILPAHITGLFFVTSHNFRKAKIEHAISVGAGPELTIDGLEPLNVLDPGDGTQKTSFTYRFVYKPDEFGNKQIGFFLGQTIIPSSVSSIDEIDQTIVGLYGRVKIKKTTIMAAFFHINNDIEYSSGAKQSSSFNNAYIQAEAPLLKNWLIYGRLEGTDDSNDVYLTLFPDFAEGRKLIGVRFDFTKQQAIALEVGTDRIGNQSHNKISVQWSSVFP